MEKWLLGNKASQQACQLLQTDHMTSCTVIEPSELLISESLSEACRVFMATDKTHIISEFWINK